MQSYSINSQKRKLQAITIAFIIITMLSQWFIPLVARAADSERSIEVNQGMQWGYKTANSVTSDYVLHGSGKFVMRSFVYFDSVDNTVTYKSQSYLFSDKPVYCSYYSVNGGDSFYNKKTLISQEYNGVYYVPLYGQSGSAPVKYDDFDFWVKYKGYTNVIETYGQPNSTDFSTLMKNLIDSGTLDLSKDDYKELVFDTDTAQFSSDIPTPRITVDNNYNLSFNNATDNYYFQIKGRWYSVDDIELYKQSAQWKYKYNSIIKSGLTEWTEKAIKTNISDLNLATLGKSAFDNFLSQNPIDSRSYTGGTNALGNYFSGYNDALSTIKMLLKQPTTLYNGLEIYVRYFEFDSSGVAHYGKWCHYYDNLANANGSSGSQWDDKDNMFMGNQSSSGLTDDQFNDVENTGNSTKADTDLVPDYNDSGSGSVIIGDTDLTSITTTLKSLYSQGQEIINMFGQVFSFLPSWLTAFICTSIGLVCLIGIIKALRG